MAKRKPPKTYTLTLTRKEYVALQRALKSLRKLRRELGPPARSKR
jgi:hypothetical protein